MKQQRFNYQQRSSLKLSQSAEFNQLITLNATLIKIQSWVRMLITRRRLRQKLHVLDGQRRKKITTHDLNKLAVQEFVMILKNRKLTPEECFRAANQKQMKAIRTDIFMQYLLEKQLVTNNAQAQRLALLIDEDFSGEITIEELQKTLKAYHFECEIVEGQEITLEQISIIKVLENLKQKNISPIELFNAIDVDSNQQLTLHEVTRFISQLVNVSEEDEKRLKDKEIMIFMNYMDIDRNDSISKGEFLAQYSKLEKVANRQNAQYQQYLQQKSKDDQIKRNNFDDSEIEIRKIIQRMQREGIYFDHLFNHLSSISGESDNNIKLGILLKQLQMSYPTIALDQIRQFLRWIPIQNNKYNLLDLSIFLSRFRDETISTNSLFQSYSVIAQVLKVKEILPDTLIKQYFTLPGQNITYELFNNNLQILFQLPQESIIEIYHSLLIDKGSIDVKKEDLLLVLNSFYFESDKISMNNINAYISNFDSLLPPMKKVLASQYLIEKMLDRKVQPISVYKLGQTNNQTDSINQSQIQLAFSKLIPTFTSDYIEFVFSNEKYTKEQFLEILKPENIDKKGKLHRGDINSQKMGYIKLLDDALLQMNMSPALLFKEADANKNKKVDLMELKEILVNLQKQQLQKSNGQQQNQDLLVFDDAILKLIIDDLDINGNGQLEEQEFYALIKLSRQQQTLKSQIQTPQAETLELVSRIDLLPTRQNLLKIQKATTIQSSDSDKFSKSAILTEDLLKAFEDIEHITSIKNALSQVVIMPNLKILLRDLSQILKDKGISLKQLVTLYKLIDTFYTGQMHAQHLLQLINEFYVNKSKPMSINVEFNIICRIISLDAQCLGNVKDYFMKNSDSDLLGNPSTILSMQNLDHEFQRLFKFQTIINNLIFESVKNKFQYGLDRLQNKHLYLFIQQIYDILYPDEERFFRMRQQKLYLIDLDNNKVDDQHLTQRDVNTLANDQKVQILRKLILSALGQEKGPRNLKDILAIGGYPVDKPDVTMQAFSDMFFKANKLLTQDESNTLFQYLCEVLGSYDYSTFQAKNTQPRIKSLDMFNYLVQMQTQISQRETKIITQKMEETAISIHDIILQNITFVQSGLISKINLGRVMIKAYCNTENKVFDYEIRFVLNQIDKDNNQTLEIDEIQEYLKLYTKSRQISMKIYFKYCAFKLDLEHRQLPTKDVLKYDLKTLAFQSPDPGKQFAYFLNQYFQHTKKPELLLDLYDYIASIVADNSLDSVISYFYAQVDILRVSITQQQRYRIRNNQNLRNDVINELIRQRPNFPIYKIMDDLQFTEDSGAVIPSLALRNHLKKLYPYADENKIRLFVTLVDINSDDRIEIQELFKFFNEIYSEEMTYENVLNRIAVIIYSTKETIESFFKVHQIDIKKIQTNLTFSQFVQAIAQLFRISKYEAYIVFIHLRMRDSNLIDFHAFLDSLRGQLMRLELTEDDESKENKELEDKINNYKTAIAESLKSKFLKMAKTIRHEQEIEESKRGMQDQENKSQNDSVVAKEQEQKKELKKLSNIEILKIFLDNYKELNTLQLIKRSCLNFQQLIKQSSVLRANLLTKRACQVQQMFYDLSKTTSDFDEDSQDQVTITLLEQEKVLLTIIAMEQVTKAFECNIFRFQKMIKRLNERSTLDFQMLQKIVEQRYKLINEMLYEDFMTIQTVIEKIRAKADQYNIELQIKEMTTMQELLVNLSSVFGLTFRPKEIILISRELKITRDNHSVEFAKLKLFLAQCNIKIKLKESLNFIFDSLDQALIGLQTLKDHLSQHPYININETLIQTKEFQPLEWMSNSKINQIQAMFISMAHQNKLITDCIVQMNSDQIDKRDHLSALLVYEDMPEHQQQLLDHQFIIVKVNQQFVICNKELPYTKKDPSNPMPLFSYNSKYPLASLIEKAFAVYLGSYENLQSLSTIYKIYQLLNYDTVELYQLSDKDQQFKLSYQDLYDNYFQRNIMRSFFFRMPAQKKKTQNPLISGLEGGRVYSVIAVIQLKFDAKLWHNLVVVYNPYIAEDPRKNGEIWGKQYLNNVKKNKKIIDLIKEQYDPSVYEFICDASNSAYTYDFKDIFENGDSEELNLVLLYKMQEMQEVKIQSFEMTFNGYIKQNIIQVKKEEKNDSDSAFCLLQLHLEDFNNYSFFLSMKYDQKQDYYQKMIGREEKTIKIDRQTYGSKYAKTIFIPDQSNFQAKLIILDSEQPLNNFLGVEAVLYYEESRPLKIQITEIENEKQAPILAITRVRSEQPASLIQKSLILKENTKENNEEEDENQTFSFVKRQTEKLPAIDQNSSMTQSQQAVIKDSKQLPKIAASSSIGQQPSKVKEVSEQDEYYDEEYDDEEAIEVGTEQKGTSQGPTQTLHKQKQASDKNPLTQENIKEQQHKNLQEQQKTHSSDLKLPQINNNSQKLNEQQKQLKDIDVIKLEGEKQSFSIKEGVKKDSIKKKHVGQNLEENKQIQHDQQKKKEKITENIQEVKDSKDENHKLQNGDSQLMIPKENKNQKPDIKEKIIESVEVNAVKENSPKQVEQDNIEEDIDEEVIE